MVFVHHVSACWAVLVGCALGGHHHGPCWHRASGLPNLPLHTPTQAFDLQDTLIQSITACLAHYFASGRQEEDVLWGMKQAVSGMSMCHLPY